jgi:hypothetical protein
MTERAKIGVPEGVPGRRSWDPAEPLEYRLSKREKMFHLLPTAAGRDVTGVVPA